MDDIFAKAVFSTVSRIPKGKVATYGQIAEMLSRRGNTRQVGTILSRAESFGDYPCHRVVNAAGRTAPGFFLQRTLLEQEGVPFRENGCVDLSRCRWDGR